MNIRCNAQGVTLDANKKIEASVLGGWFFTGNNSYPKIKNAPLYSLSAAYCKNPQLMYELNINSCFSKMLYNSSQGNGDTSVRYTQTYIMLGIVRMFKTEIPNFMPYMSANIGVSSMSVHAPGAVSQMKLAAGVLGGIKVALNKRLGLKFQVRVQAPLNGLGLSVGISTGGPGVGIGSYSSAVQFDVSTGLFFRL
ncbi:hypothetical protein [Cytophaga aurantiaca]|uniref:hypothetical protein n=1 Tax=Cytophaga aurantiaca TaxID=29530 RepID=UPI0012F96EA0|nr:hypothetical protein [Cytophaga aurantiaca]